MKFKIDVTDEFPTVDKLKGDFDLLVNGFNGCAKVKYGKELSGQTEVLKTLCKLSEKSDKVIISGFDTDNYGIIRKSVGVFDGGKLLGISDMTTVFEDSGYMPGGGGKLYDTKIGKIGVAVGDDVYSFGLFKSLAVCGAEVIVSLSDFKRKEINSILIRAYSFLLGVPTLLLFNSGSYCANVKGELEEITKDGTYDVFPYTEFILKTTKTRLNK